MDNELAPPTTTTTTTNSNESTNTAASTTPGINLNILPNEAKMEMKGEIQKIQITFNKQNYDIELGSENILGELRQLVFKATQVDPPLQKLMLKGILKDDQATLASLNIKSGIKIGLIGSRLEDVMKTTVAPVEAQTQQKEEETAAKTEPLSEQTKHKKIISQGVPEGATPGRLGRNEPLPGAPIQGVLNNIGQKVRLTFKTFSGELWISSTSNTQKLNFTQIQTVSSEPIKGKEEYHIMTLTLGPTSKYYLYYVQLSIFGPLAFRKT